MDSQWNEGMFRKRLASLAAEIREEKKHDCGCGLKAIGGRYSDFAFSLRRHKMNKGHKCGGCIMGRGALEDGLHVLWRSAQPSGREFVLKEYYELARLCRDFCQHGINKMLKERTATFKMGGEFIHPQWRLGCYWEQLYGYHPYAGVDNMEEEARKWLYEINPLGGFFTEEEYAGEIYGETRSILTQFWVYPKEVPTKEAWLTAGRWVRGKAGTGAKTTIEIDGRTEKSRSMKGVDAALKSDGEIGEELRTPYPEQFHVMEKSEGGKSRPVVKTSNESNRKMDFLSEVVEKGLYGTRFSTLYAGTAGNNKIDAELVELTRDPNYIKVPLDQKNFDQHQSLLTIQAVMGAIGDHMEEAEVPNEYMEVWAALWDSVFFLGGEVTVGKKKFPWRNGLPSGWRWTAFLDTMLNLASCRIIQRLVEKLRNKPLRTVVFLLS